MAIDTTNYTEGWEAKSSSSGYGVYGVTTKKYDIYIADSTGMVAYRDDSGWAIKNAEAALEILYQLHLKNKP